MIEKTCTACRTIKPKTAFATRGRLADGTPKLRTKCKVCDWARVYALKVEWRKNNPEKVAETKRRGRKPDLRRGEEQRRRARRAGVPHAPYSRTEIFTRYGNECAYCGSTAEHLDHVVPISKGGADAAHNLLPACAGCNLSKGARSLAEWALTWLSSPEESLALKAPHNSKEESGNHDLQNA